MSFHPQQARPALPPVPPQLKHHPSTGHQHHARPPLPPLPSSSYRAQAAAGKNLFDLPLEISSFSFSALFFLSFSFLQNNRDNGLLLSLPRMHSQPTISDRSITSALLAPLTHHALNLPPHTLSPFLPPPPLFPPPIPTRISLIPPLFSSSPAPGSLNPPMPSHSPSRTAVLNLPVQVPFGAANPYHSLSSISTCSPLSTSSISGNSLIPQARSIGHRRCSSSSSALKASRPALDPRLPFNRMPSSHKLQKSQTHSSSNIRILHSKPC